ncbi:MAG: KRRI-Interacting protein 1 [Chaenotheca gracillima]|nr:MAG: KRRI-Interacting protein 1 [Chaenotheca gracillima]
MASLSSISGSAISDAKDKNVDAFKGSNEEDAPERFITYLTEHQYQIQTVVAGHLGLSKSEKCLIPRNTEWLHGRFNIGLPVAVTGWQRRVLIRFPLPHKIGEGFRPGNVDEKLRCEAATHAWVDENCPDVPIPHMWGFGLSKGRTFSAVEHAPLVTRCLQYIRRIFLRMLRYPLPSRYIPLRTSHELEVGYILTDFYDEQGCKTLSASWEDQQHDETLRANLFKGLSRIILSLGRLPLPRVGSFSLDDHGYLRLTNRPLNLELHQMENEEIPIELPRDHTYSATEPYMLDLISCHRMRLDVIQEDEDGSRQGSAMAFMETSFPSFFGPSHDDGPYALTLTDLQRSNIFVDAKWNVTCLVGLDWACARPVEMQHPPCWLTSQSVDAIDVDAFDKLRKEFMAEFRDEETRSYTVGVNNSDEKDKLRFTDIMEKGWENGSFWYSLALDSPTALLSLLNQHIQPIFEAHEYETPAMLYPSGLMAVGWSGYIHKIDDSYVVKKPKLFPDYPAYNDQFHDIITTERQIYERLGDHKGVIKYHGIEDSETGAIKLTHAKQGDLSTYIPKHSRPSQRFRMRWIQSLVETFNHIHCCRVLHQDIKLNNILVDNDCLKVIDFGNGAIFPMDANMEAVCADDPLSRVDLLCLGSVIYSIATWQVFAYDYFEENRWPVPEELPTTKDVLFGGIITRCWEDKYPTIASLYKDVNAWLERTG